MTYIYRNFHLNGITPLGPLIAFSYKLSFTTQYLYVIFYYIHQYQYLTYFFLDQMWMNTVQQV